ncbi:MAG: hypothetical protein JW762_04440 [Dehalococcoidales bacterium]|nr:hypothetical protein [Dehalococcoidales bacterium]
MNNELESTTIAKIEEYRALREELMHSMQFRIWGVTSYSLFSGAILSFAAIGKVPAAYLFPIAIAIPYILYTAYMERIRRRIGAYIRVFIEKVVPDMKYETYLTEFRYAPKSSRWYRFMDTPRYAVSLIGVYLIVAILCFTFIFVLQDTLWIRILGTVLILLLAISLSFYVEVSKPRRSYDEIWEEIYTKHNSKNNPPTI